MNKEKMYSTIEKQLADRHWGVRAKGQSDGNHPRYYIMDYRGFALATGIIRYSYYKDHKEKNMANVRIFYRGQRRNWGLKAGAYRNCRTRQETERVDSWLEKALESIKPVFDPSGEYNEREALAQHYGLKTRCLDVADNFQSALWFAYDDLNQKESRYDESVGYIQVMAIPEDEVEVIDIRNKPSEWLRPHVQQGFAIKRKIPYAENGSFDKYLVATFIVPRENLRRWSNYDCLVHDYFYPSLAVDKGARYWEKAKASLVVDGISLEPPV